MIAAHVCSGKHRTRLFVGEGNFSYTEAIIEKHKEKHPNLANSIIATELMEESDLKGSMRCVSKDEGKKIVYVSQERIERLKEKGVRVLFKIDCTQLHGNPALNNISRIHWNLPLNDEPKGSFGDLLTGFFMSCRKVQQVRDRVYITLLQGDNKSKPRGKMAPDWIYQQGYKARLIISSSVCGYKLIKKRAFRDEGKSSRYEKYITRNSYDGRPLNKQQIQHIREFVFEKQAEEIKSEDLEDLQKYTDPQKSKIKVKKFAGYETYIYYDCPTDDDSSDYSEPENAELE